MKIAKSLILLMMLTTSAYSSDIIMVRSPQNFPEAMLTLQSSISDHGYTVTRVQRIDIGLTGMGYKTDKYRVVFVAKAHEIKRLINKYPVLAAYFPPKVSIFAEGDTTMLVTANPKIYSDMVSDENDKIIFKRWENDVYSIFNEIKSAE